MALSVDDLLIGAPRLRTKSVNYGPGLDFHLHSFSAGVYRNEMLRLSESEDNATDDDSGMYDEVVIRLAMKLISGENFEATPEQVIAFREKLDEGVIRSIVHDGLDFNRGADDLAEAAKKS